jgi:hypothetical protein
MYDRALETAVRLQLYRRLLKCREILSQFCNLKLGQYRFYVNTAELPQVPVLVLFVLDYENFHPSLGSFGRADHKVSLRHI